MNILIVDTWGGGLDFALRCQQVGHSVKWFLPPRKNGYPNKAGDGMVKKVTSWEPHMKWADLVFCVDNTKYTYDLTRFIDQGFPVFGPTWQAAELELNRKKGQEAFKAAGIKTMVGQEFDSYRKAIAWVKANPKRYVSKPNGDADKALSYCSKNAADLVFMLEKWSKSNTLKESFIIQEFVAGIEMAVGGWFGPHGFGKHVLENWEFKKLMNDDMGVATGEQGTVLKYTTESLLAEKVLYPLEDTLHRLNYTGYVDINCIIDKRGNPWPLEFTNRPGWPLFQIQQALHKGDPAEWMIDCINGSDTLRVSDQVAVGVVMSMPDYPYNKVQPRELEGIPIYGVTESNCKHLHPSEVMMGNAPYMDSGEVKYQDMWVTSGNYVLTASNTGPTVKEAKCKAYDVLDQLDMPNSKMWRTDIGHRLEKQLPDLHDMGYALGLEYGSD